MRTLSDLFAEWLRKEEMVDEEINTMKAGGVTSSDVIKARLISKFGEGYSNPWFDALILPVVDQLKSVGGFDRVETIGPCGLNCLVFIECYENKDDDHCRSFVVSPNLEADAPSPLSLIDTSTRDGSCQPGTVGFFNGFDHPRTDIPPGTSGSDWLVFLNE